MLQELRPCCDWLYEKLTASARKVYESSSVNRSNFGCDAAGCTQWGISRATDDPTPMRKALACVAPALPAKCLFVSAADTLWITI